MLDHKATQSTTSLLKHISGSDDSEFEIVGHEYCNGGSDMTSYYSDSESSPFSPKGDLNPNTVPVSVEFHPPTPTSMATPITTSTVISNETFLSLEDDNTTCEIELKEILASSPEPHPVPETYVNSSPECISASEGMYGTPGTDSVPERHSREQSPHNIDTDNNQTKLSSDIGTADSKENLTDHSSVQFHTPDDHLEVKNPLLMVTDRSSLRVGGLTPDVASMSPLLDSQNVTLTMATLELRRSSTPEQRSIPKSSSWLNLTGGSIEMLQFVSNKQGETTDGAIGRGSPAPEDNVIRSVPWSSVSSLQ